MNPHNKYWMVHGISVPNFRHDSLESANREAERLARLHRGQSFTVLESVATCCANDLTWTTHETDDNEVIF